MGLLRRLVDVSRVKIPVPVRSWPRWSRRIPTRIRNGIGHGHALVFMKTIGDKAVIPKVRIPHRTPSIGVTACCCTPPNPPKEPASNDGHGLPDRRQLALELRRARQAYIPRLPAATLQVRVEQGEEYHVVLEVGVRPRARLKTVTPLPSRSCTDTPTLRNSPHARPYSIIERWQAPSRLQGRWWQRSLRLSFLFGVTSPRFWPAPPAPFCARTRVLRGKTEWRFLRCLGRMSGCPSQKTLNLSPG